MLFLFDKSNRRIEPCRQTNLKDHKLLERQDLEKWVEMCPDILGEEVLFITAEYDRFDKTNERLDLLALDKDGKIVVVELKRDDSGKNVDLQALKYAAYCSIIRLQDLVEIHQAYLKQKGQPVSSEDAEKIILGFIENEEFEEIDEKPRIILVSSGFRQEVTASVLWLRKFGIDIKCVKLSPYQLEDGNIALDSSTLIPLPEAEEFIIRTEKKENVEYGKSVTQNEYYKFYEDLLGRIKPSLQGKYLPPAARSYQQIPTSISRVHFEWAFHGRPRNYFGVELHFEKANKAANIELLERILPLCARLEVELGQKPVIQKEWGKKWSRIYIHQPEGRMTEELKQWAADKMMKLITLCLPEIEKMQEM